VELGHAEVEGIGLSITNWQKFTELTHETYEMVASVTDPAKDCAENNVQ
jgi:hypothetical protein